jgi:two-component system CheB/CheR fusion protein
MFSRLSDGNIQYEEIDIHELVDEIKFDLEILVKEKKATINCTGLSVINGIPGQIRQLFQNLLSNSLKFSKKDVFPVVDISAALHEVNGKKIVKIIFKDNGIGFDESYAEKIFVIFQRLHPKQMYEGTGIGLAIVKKIVSLHGGEIIAKGIENEGATFEISLPQ